MKYAILTLAGIFSALWHIVAEIPTNIYFVYIFPGWMSPKKDAMEGVPTDLTALTALPGTPSPQFVENVTQSTEWFDQFKEEEQTWFVRMLLSRMHHHQHGSVNSYLKPMLQRDFITLLPKKGLDHVAEAILGYLDAKSLCAAELVCRSWLRVISDGMYLLG